MHGFRLLHATMLYEEKHLNQRSCGIQPHLQINIQWSELYVVPAFFGIKSIGTNSLMCIKVVQSLVFGPRFLAGIDYIKLVTLQTCWMHSLFVLVVFLIILCPIEIHGK